MSTAMGASASGEVVPMPRWSSIVGCARAVVAILVLAFTAAATGIWGGYTAFGFALFTASATLIIFAYYHVALSRRPELYNCWAVLSLEIFGTIFWLVSFSLLAQWTSVYNDFWYGEGDSYGFWRAPFAPSEIGLSKRSLVKRASNKYHAGVALAGTAAGLGAVEFILYTLTLVVFSMSLHKQRVAAMTSNTRATTGGPTTAPATETEAQKVEETAEVKTEPDTV